MAKIISLCGGVNKDITKYYNTSKILTERDDASTTLKTIFKECSETFKKNNGKYPKKVVIYRDGASESQKGHVLAYEVQPIEEALKELEKEVKLAMILVCKRISVKVFQKGGDSFKNPDPGTIVHEKITKNSLEDHEFYMVGQKALQGTVVPTHYSFVYNTTDLDPNKIHELTYKLCYTYFNVSGSIRVPSLVQYATRFSAFIEELSKRGKNKPEFKAVIPHAHLEKNIQSLFFI